MALTPEQQEVLANEARRNELKVREAEGRGAALALAKIVTLVSNENRINGEVLTAARNERLMLEAAIGTGLSEVYGTYSALEQAMRTERFAGKSAAIDYIKANPTCTEADAVTAYETAALAARPADQQYLVQNGANLLLQYAHDAVDMGLIADTTWATFRAFVIATDKDAIMAL